MDGGVLWQAELAMKAEQKKVRAPVMPNGTGDSPLAALILGTASLFLTPSTNSCAILRTAARKKGAARHGGREGVARGREIQAPECHAD